MTARVPRLSKSAKGAELISMGKRVAERSASPLVGQVKRSGAGALGW
jgi:hypothetical protein